MNKDFLEKELIKHDKDLVRRIGQYKEPMIYYNYAMMLKLEELLGKKSKLPGITKFRKFCNEVRKSDMYKNYDEFLEFNKRREK